MRLRRPQHVLEGAVPLGGARDAWRVAEGGAPEALGGEKGVGNATENGWVLTRENWGVTMILVIKLGIYTWFQ